MKALPAPARPFPLSEIPADEIRIRSYPFSCSGAVRFFVRGALVGGVAVARGREGQGGGKGKKHAVATTTVAGAILGHALSL